MRLFFIRHAKPKIINGEFFRCRLSDEGIRMTKDLASSGKLPKPDLILSSPYYRAIDTAKVFSEVFRMDFSVADFLMEWNLQSLNLPDPEYSHEELKGWGDLHARVRGDESLHDVQKRIYEGAVAEISKHPDLDNIFFICHGTVIDMLCTLVSGRQARLSDIKGMKHLDYAVLEYHSNKIELIKDII